MELLLWQIMLIVTGFGLVYFSMDTIHDTWFKLDKVNLAKDPDLAKKYSKKWHAIDFFIKGLVILFAWFMLSINFVDANGAIYNAFWPVMGFGVMVVIYLGSIRWIWHDELWNILNKQKFGYAGGEARMDKIGKTIWMRLGMKVSLLGLSVLLIILYNNNFL